MRTNAIVTERRADYQPGVPTARVTLPSDEKVLLQLTMNNILENFTEVIQSTGVKRLENLFSGRPAILVAAGPSLEKNVHLLREVQGRAVIIAVDTTLRLLLPLGIIPDIVTTIDFSPANFAKFTNIPIPPEISLVYHPAGYYESIRAFNGPRFTQSNTGNRLPAWLMKYVDDKGFIQSGTTVAHLSFHLAQHLGCDPIAFIGQDLAFTGQQQHAADLSLWHLDKKDLEVVEDIFGEPVSSMPSFRHDIHHFEKVFKETAATVIDATEAGAKKQGAKVMRLRDVIDEYGRIAPMDIKGMLGRVAEETEAVRLDELLRDMRCISAEMELIKKDCREILDVARKLGAKIGAGQTDDDRSVKLSCMAEKLTSDIEDRGRSMHLLGEQNYALKLYMMQYSTATIDEIEDIDEKIKQQVERAQVFYPSLSRAAETFKKPLDRLIHRLEQAHELAAREPEANATAGEWCKRALAFRKIDYRREAYEALNHALARNPDHAPALKALTQLCLYTNRFHEATQLVQRLQRLIGSDRKLQTLAKEAESKHRAWTERCERLRAEFAKKEQEDSSETAGWFYYRAKDYARAVSKLEQAIAQHPTPEAYARLGRARLKAGNVEGAVRAWEEGLGLDPSRPDLYKELGDLALDRGMKEQGESLLEEALRYEPDDAGSCQRLAALYYERGAYVEAGACLENLLRLSPERLDLIPQIMALYLRQIALTGTSQ